MKGNVLSYILAGYALYNALSNKRALDEYSSAVDDLKKGQDGLEDKIEEMTTTTRNLLDENLTVDYTLVCGRPTSMSKLSASLHFTINNLSDKNTYIVKGIMFTPILGTTICNTSAQKLLNLYWSSGVRLAPKASSSFRLSFNDLNLPKDVFTTVSNYLLQQFHNAAGWDKLGDKYASVQGGCLSDIWLLANAPYIDSIHDYLITRREVKGNLDWHGGNYLPGNTNSSTYKDYETKMGTVLKFSSAQEVFRLQ